MKPKMKLAILALIAPLAVGLVGCSDSDDSSKQEVLTEVITVEAPTNNSFQEIQTLNEAWTVTEYPDWAAPMDESGNAGDSLVLFVEINDEGIDRTGEVVVHYEKSGDQRYKVTQLSSDQNSELATELNAGDLKLTYGVGYTTNVFKVSKDSKYYMSASTPINFKRLKTRLQEIGESDAMMDEARYYSRTESVTGSTTSALSNQLAINAGIEVGVSAFKLNVEGGYSSTSNGSDRYEYAIEEIQHVVKSRYLRPGVLRYLVENPSETVDVYQRAFRKACDALQAAPGNQTIMKSILDTYGTHIIVHSVIGGELKLSMQMKVTDNSSSSDIHAALELGSKVVNANGEFNMSNKESSIANNTTISLVTYGGKNVYTVSPNTTFAQFMNSVKDHDKLTAWEEEILNEENLSVIDMEVIPIYELMPTEAMRTALRNYMIGAYQTTAYASDVDYKGPDLYVLQGFDLAHGPKIEISKTLTIPEIDVEVMARWESIPEIDPQHNVVAIYSGNIGSVGTDRGFFVGSDAHRPCKFKRAKDGSIKIEEFDRLDQSSLTELYVDVTGDVTIAPKTESDFYSTRTFDAWPEFEIDLTNYDLSTPIDFNATLTGKATSVTLAPDVTVSLDVVKISDQLTCQGSATITLVQLAKNEIGSLQAGPKGTTLIIQGDGILYATATDGAAIGANTSDCGDIIINDGTITATSTYGAGIGGSGRVSKDVSGKYNCGNITINNGLIVAKSTYGCGIGNGNGLDNWSGCGDITITGGSVEAVSGDTRDNGTRYSSAGIGCAPGGYCGNILISGGSVMSTASCQFAAAIGTAGGWSTCGDITIKSTIDCLIARKHSEATSAIGKGYSQDICGTVTIEDSSKVLEE